jgi:murein DD-endopeptidase MepM/ murein hydrolase activator NlpD
VTSTGRKVATASAKQTVGVDGRHAVSTNGKPVVVASAKGRKPEAARRSEPVNGRRVVVANTRLEASLPPSTLVLGLPNFTDLVPLFAWPVDGQVSSPFGRRRMGWHRGVDIKADLGTPVSAAASGIVLVSGFEGQYGRVVKIEHPHGFVTVYAHNDENRVEAGDRVMMGQIIAAVGRTGHATTYHLHFEIRHGGLSYNPLYMLPLPPRVTHVEDGDEEESEEADD